MCGMYDMKRSPISVCGKGGSMIKPVDLHRDLAGLPLLKERYGHPTDAESLQSFATLAAYRDGGIFATHFSGSSGWERHPQGYVVVPQGCWHRFEPATGVKVMTVTHKPTQHTHEDDPRTAVLED